MKRFALLACAATVVACNGETAASSLVAASIIRRADTVQFEVPLTVYRCDSTADFLLQGIQSGNGVMLWMRPGDSPVGEFPIVGVRDTITRPGAVVAIRYYHEAVVHSFTLDSGSVSVADSGTARQLSVTGSGMEISLGIRSRLAARIAALPTPAESTMSCVPVP